jgi:hypothetical protein
LSCDDLYALHLDTCGAPKGDLARKKRPENSLEVIGAVQIGLLSQGAQLDGNHYLVGGARIRVVNGQGRLLSAVRKLYSDEPTDFIEAETTICVGAKDDGGVPPDVVRTATGNSTIIRTTQPMNWITEDDAKLVWAGNGDYDVNTAAG